MIEKFIYVFDRGSYEKLKACGFKLVKANEDKAIYVFLNEPSQNFDLNGSSYVKSDMLTF